MAYEDFTTYTEVDPNSHISIISSTEIHVSGLTRNEDAYVYFDYTTGYFTEEFTHYIDITPITTTGGGVGVFYLLSNVIDDYYAIQPNYPHIRIWINPTTSGEKYLSIKARHSDGNIDSDSMFYTGGTRYYLKIVRTSTQVVLYVYSDSEHTNLIDTLPISMDTTSFRYFFPVNSYNSGVSYSVEFYVYNYEIVTTTPSSSSSQKFIPEYFSSTFTHT